MNYMWLPLVVVLAGLTLVWIAYKFDTGYDGDALARINRARKFIEARRVLK